MLKVPVSDLADEPSRMHRFRRSNAIWKSRLRIASRASSISELIGDPDVSATIRDGSLAVGIRFLTNSTQVGVMTIEP